MDKVSLQEILLNQITPDLSQPRHLIYSIDEMLEGVQKGDPRILAMWESLTTLATSILEVGLQQPISVYPTEHGFTIYDGHRRWLAMKLLHAQGQAGMDTILCYVRSRPHQDEDALLGQLNVNTQREDFNVFELARSLRQIYEYLRSQGGTVRFVREDGTIETSNLTLDMPDEKIWEAIERKVGIGRSRRYQIDAVLKLPLSIQQLAEEAGIPESKLRFLIPIKDEPIQARIIREVLTQNLSNAEIKTRIQAIKDEDNTHHDSPMPKPIQIESALKPIKKLVAEIEKVKDIKTAVYARDQRIVARYREVMPELRSMADGITAILEKLEFLENQ